MRTTRLGAALASLVITAGTAALLAEAPAQAGTPTSTATTARLTIDHHTRVKGQYGDPIGYLEATISDPNGGLVYAGSAVLQRRLPGRGWKNVKTDGDGTDGIGFGSYGSHAKGNLEYRLHYLGGTDSNTATTYAPSYSDIVTVTTLWNFKDTSACPNGHCHISGRLIPRAKHHKILVQVKHGSWKKYRVLHTSAKGTYKVGVSGSRGHGTRYRIIISRTKSIVATKKGYRVVRL